MLRTLVIRFSGEAKSGSADRARAFVFIEWLLCEVHPCLVTPSLLPAGRLAPACKVLQSAAMLGFVRSGINALGSLFHTDCRLQTLMRFSPKTCDVTLKLCVQLFKSCLPSVHCTHDQNVTFTFKGPHCSSILKK